MRTRVVAALLTTSALVACSQVAGTFADPSAPPAAAVAGVPGGAHADLRRRPVAPASGEGRDQSGRAGGRVTRAGAAAGAAGGTHIKQVAKPARFTCYVGQPCNPSAAYWTVATGCTSAWRAALHRSSCPPGQPVLP